MDDRKIHVGVRATAIKTDDGRRNTTKRAIITDPEDLVKAAGEKGSDLDLQALHDSGAISGTWKGVTAAKGPEAAKTAKK